MVHPQMAFPKLSPMASAASTPAEAASILPRFALVTAQLVHVHAYGNNSTGPANSAQPRELAAALLASTAQLADTTAKAVRQSNALQARAAALEADNTLLRNTLASQQRPQEPKSPVTEEARLRSKLDAERLSSRQQVLAALLQRDEAKRLQEVAAADAKRLEASMKCNAQEAERQRHRAADCLEKLRKAAAKERRLEQAAEASVVERGGMERQLVAAALRHSDLQQRLDAVEAKLAEAHAADERKRLAAVSTCMQTIEVGLVDAVLLEQAEQRAAVACAELREKVQEAEARHTSNIDRISELASEVASAQADAKAACSQAADARLQAQHEAAERVRVVEACEQAHKRVQQELSASKDRSARVEGEWKCKLEKVEQELSTAKVGMVQVREEGLERLQRQLHENARLESEVQRTQREFVDRAQATCVGIAQMRGSLKVVEHTWDAVETRLQISVAHAREVWDLHSNSREQVALRHEMKSMQAEMEVLAGAKERFDASEAERARLERALECANQEASQEQTEHKAAKAEIAHLGHVQQVLGLTKGASALAWQQAMDELQSIRCDMLAAFFELHVLLATVHRRPALAHTVKSSIYHVDLSLLPDLSLEGGCP
jgi:hypothetical protein